MSLVEERPPYRIDSEARTVTSGGRTTEPLPPKAFAIINTLAEHAGEWISGKDLVGGERREVLYLRNTLVTLIKRGLLGVGMPHLFTSGSQGYSFVWPPEEKKRQPFSIAPHAGKKGGGTVTLNDKVVMLPPQLFAVARFLGERPGTLVGEEEVRVGIEMIWEREPRLVYIDLRARFRSFGFEDWLLYMDGKFGFFPPEVVEKEEPPEDSRADQIHRAHVKEGKTLAEIALAYGMTSGDVNTIILTREQVRKR